MFTTNATLLTSSAGFQSGWTIGGGIEHMLASDWSMKIEYLHASKYGNGATVAAEFNKQTAARGVTVHVHHIREVTPADLPEEAARAIQGTYFLH